jgi:hypothetical protein
MRGAKTAPYLRADTRAIQCGPWMMGANRKLEDGELLKEWDQSLDIDLSRFVRIDLGVFAGTAKLGVGCQLGAIPSWWSDGTNLRGHGEPCKFSLLEGEKYEDLKMTLRIPGAHLAGNLMLRTSIVLLEAPKGRAGSKLAATMPGSVLWEDGLFVIIEGKASRFPVTALDFEKSSLGTKEACWLLDWSPRDLVLPAMACLRIYVNSGHVAFHRAVTTPEPGPTEHAVRSAMKCGVAEEMVRLALENVEDLESHEDDLPPGSVGMVFMDLLGQVFPERTPRQLVEFRRKEPGKFQAQMQSQVRLFSGLEKGEES